MTFQPQTALLKAKSPGRSQGPNTGLFLALTGHALHVTPACMHSIVRGALIELNGSNDQNLWMTLGGAA